MINYNNITNEETMHAELIKAMPRIEINTLVNYGGNLLNRDKSGFAKRITFGGVERLRISSQCLKYAIRRAKVENDTWNTINCANLVSCEIQRREPSATPEYLETVEKIVNEQLTPKSDKEKTAKKDHMFKVCKYDIEDFATFILEEFPLNQPVDDKEIKYDAKHLDKTAGGRVQKKMKETSAKRSVTPEIAMFGRMSTSETLRSVDGAVCMNHAFTTNAMAGDIDEFTAIDEWMKGEQLGASMLGDTDINSGCFYKYVCINTLTLAENLLIGVDYTDIEEIKRRMQMIDDIVCEFIHLYAVTAPVAKQTSMATYAAPSCMYITAGVRVANFSYENAFARPAVANGDMDIVTDSVRKLVHSIDNDPFNLNTYDKRIWIGTDEYDVPKDVTVENFKDALNDIRGYVHGACN